VSSELPLPPPELLGRIGPMMDDEKEGPYEVFERTGRADRELIEAALPDDWDWRDKRVLDFGCGVGRVMRRFAAEAAEAELWGCDLDRASLEWLERSLSPPFRFFESGEEPGLPQEDGYFDLIWAFSVYTHFTDNWAGWLLEHHRVLADGGFLIATFLGEGMLEPLTGERWDESRIGMNPLLHGYSWDLGGPIAFNSPWWIRAHWGRAFEIVELRPMRDPEPPSHGIVVARKKPASLGVDRLTALEPGEPREIESLRHHVAQLSEEARAVRADHDRLAARVNELIPREQELASELDQVVNSRSWQLTSPLRSAKPRRPRR
jgi:SAM-dependent methyltransferase